MSLVAYDDSDEETETISSSSSQKIRERVKIEIPSLDKFKEEESEEVPSKMMKFKSGSGLFSMLPPPKNLSDSTAGFTPYILTKKKGPIMKTKEVQSLSEKECSPSALMLQHTELSECETNDDTSGKDFFSLENVTKKESSIQDFPYEELSDITTMPSSNGVVQNDSEFSGAFMQCTNAESKVDFDRSSYEITSCSAVALGSEELGTTGSKIDVHESLLNDEAFLKLQGRRREMESINIIDVKADDQLADRSEWLMKSLTEERDLRPSKRKHDLPTQQQKRKHQITYLAFQAKERELNLKNQWAQNSRTRRETQAKYGF